MDVAEQSKMKLKVGLTKVCLSCHNQFVAELTHCPKDKTMLLTPPQNPLIDSNLSDQYEIDGIIGSGGWSLVYRAQQKSLGRAVAIKILHSHLVLDPDKVMRFQREAEAASKFNNPAIPAVYDFGLLPSGQPYMVMAYVEGRSLSEVIVQDGPLDLSKAVEIFRQCASGLAMAHEHGIIHRDIKPSNILLTKDKGEVKILDFGLAKLIDMGDGEVGKTLTQAGHTIGTPAYMSPEQCLGLTLDARSDLYSLGCVMYETITGIRPFEGRDAFEAMNLHMRGNITFDETAIKDSIPPALEACILKTLAKNPADRHQSALDLMSELEGLQTPGPQLRKTISLVRPFQNILKQRGSKLATAAATLAITGLVILTLVLGAMRSVEYFNANRVINPHNLAHAYSELFAKGERYLYAQNYSRASSYFKQSSELAENFGASDERLLTSLQRWQDSLRKENKIEDVERVSQQLEALKNSTYGLMYGTLEQNAKTIVDLTAKRDKNAKDLQLTRQLCAVLNNQAALLFTQGNVTDAKQFLDRAIELEQKLLGKTDPEYATSVSNLAYYQSQRGDKAQAEALYREALDLRRKVLGPNDPKVGRSLRNLADFCWQKGDIRQAEDLMKQSMAVYKTQLPKTTADYAWTMNNLGLINAQQRNYVEARKLFQEALLLRKQLYGEGGLDVGRTLHNLAQLDTAERRFTEAESEYTNAQKIYDTKLGVEHDDSLKCANNLAIMYYNKGNYADAEPLLRRVVSVLRQKRPDDPLGHGATKLLTKIYEHQGRKDAARELQHALPSPEIPDKT